MNLVLILFAINPQSHPAFDRVDSVVVNHVYSNDGRLTIDQVYWRDWSVNSCCWNVVDWRMLVDVRRPNAEAEQQWNRENPDGPPYVAEWIGGHATPRRDGRYWVSDWYDEKSKKWRRVVADQYAETWTDFDEELKAREILPEHLRRKLR